MMLGRRLGTATALGALAAATLISSPATAAPATVSAYAATSQAASTTPSALRKHKQKRLHLTLVITSRPNAPFTYTWTVADKRGVPVPGVKFKTQYHAVKGKWTNEGLESYVSDANGQFSLTACNLSFGVERLHSKATKRHQEIKFKYQLRQCGS